MTVSLHVVTTLLSTEYLKGTIKIDFSNVSLEPFLKVILHR